MVLTKINQDFTALLSMAYAKAVYIHGAIFPNIEYSTHDFVSEKLYLGITSIHAKMLLIFFNIHVHVRFRLLTLRLNETLRK